MTGVEISFAQYFLVAQKHMDKRNLVTPCIKNLKKTEYLIISFSADQRDIEILAYIGRDVQLNETQQVATPLA
jgi:hypothetical protein